ncbi:ASCH domain-containing protein [Bradyrhizobium sp. th.b2]|uniref:ASCH domain-containing protein n=1 Tax=Bradyrhizobium sp. th-b2 TaxID=172088 RepID=UPI00068534D6|nr:ASCH domain-containing protein [Bradyrhizobium sp. th.b2]
MKIISIRQPWASLIVTGGKNIQTGAIELKDVENRTWATTYRGPVLVHASLREDAITSDEIERRFGLRLSTDLPLGGVIGMTEIVDCVRPHASRWYAPGCYSFILANSRPLPFVRWKGALSLRAAPAELLQLCGLLSAQDGSSDAFTATAV